MSGCGHSQEINKHRERKVAVATVKKRISTMERQAIGLCTHGEAVEWCVLMCGCGCCQEVNKHKEKKISTISTKRRVGIACGCDRH